MRQLDGSELVAALGLVFVVAGVTLWSQSILPETTSGQELLYELVVHVLFGGVILAVGVHVERSELTDDERVAIVVWCFSGFALLLALAVWSNVAALLDGAVTASFASDVVFFGSLGGAFGAIAGVNRGRSTRNRKLAEHVEEQRETLVLLTRLLRHDIRNDVMAINGHAELLEDSVPPEEASSVEIIQQRSDAIVRLLRDTDALVETLDGPREYERVDLSTVLDEEVASIRDSYPDVTVEASVPDDLVVLADGLVHQLFSNLLENAVTHNDPEGLTVHLEATDGGDTVTVVVADDGAGIPEEIRDDLFELGEHGPDSEGDGLGLYLVSRLAEVYGGSVELTADAEWATRFVATLPAADAAPAESEDATEVASPFD